MTTHSQTTTVSTKGQVILPKAVRDHLSWDAGTRLTVEPTAEGVLLKPIRDIFAPSVSADVFACLPVTSGPKSIAEMQAGIDAEVRRRHARGRY